MATLRGEVRSHAGKSRFSTVSRRGSTGWRYLGFRCIFVPAVGRGGEADPEPGGGRRPRDASTVGGGALGGPERAERPPAAADPAADPHEATPAPGQQL